MVIDRPDDKRNRMQPNEIPIRKLANRTYGFGNITPEKSS